MWLHAWIQPLFLKKDDETMTLVTPQWHEWIQLNIARHCTPRSILEQMIRSNFDLVVAQDAINVAMGDSAAKPESLIESVSTSGAYVYEKSHLQNGDIVQTTDRHIKVVFRAYKPILAVLEDVLSAEECDEVIRRSMDKLQRSTTVDPGTGQHTVIRDRTSEGTYFATCVDPFITKLDRRIAELMGQPVEHGEGFQILHYREGGEYRPHYDFFPLEQAGSHAHLRTGGQRVATLIMYLNDVEAGGGTSFPKLGLEIKPKKGSAVYFEYANSLGQLDELTVHAGEPVLSGEKWIMTKWMRQRRFGEPEVVTRPKDRPS
jgi:prolyl 4-hydroxylase